jgi:hypothetical protein
MRHDYYSTNVESFDLLLTNHFIEHHSCTYFAVLAVAISQAYPSFTQMMLFLFFPRMSPQFAIGSLLNNAPGVSQFPESLPGVHWLSQSERQRNWEDFLLKLDHSNRVSKYILSEYVLCHDRWYC